MAINMASLQRRSVRKPPRMFVYGVAGIGKTTLATQAPSPIFLQTEDSEIDVPTFGLLKSFGDVIDAVTALLNEEHNFKTVVLDSSDWLEPLIWQEVCAQYGVDNIEKVEKGFGKGYTIALNSWRMFLDGLNALRDHRDMAVIILGHAHSKKADNPETDSYDRYMPKMQKDASALLQEHVDAIFFANYRITTVKTDAGFNKKVVRGVGGGERLLFTSERPAFIAKHRKNFILPDSIPLDWNALAAGIPYYNPAVESAPVTE